MTIHCFEDPEGVLSDAETVVNVQYRGDIPASVAVIGGRPDGHQVPFWKHVFVSLLHQLMRATYEREIVDPIEFGRYLAPEQIPGASRTDGPSAAIQLFRIGPHKI